MASKMLVDARLPTYEELRALKVGDHVKVCNGEERFWVLLEDVFPAPDVSDTLYIGVVDNHLVSRCSSHRGDYLALEARHIYEILRTAMNLAEVYYSPLGYWKGLAAISKLASAAKVPVDVALEWLKK